MQKSLVFVLIFSLFLFVGVSIYLLQSNLRLKESFKETSQTKTEKFKENIESQQEQLREDIKRDMEEKYQADMVSYRAMSRRLEQEKQRQKELQEKIEELEEKNK